MIGVFTEQCIELDNRPAKFSYNACTDNIEEQTEIYKEKTMDEFEFLNLMNTYSFMGNAKLNETQDFFYNQAIKKMHDIILVEMNYIKSDNIEPPSPDVINKTSQIIRMLAFKDIYPNRIATSAEDGICLTFKNGNKICYLEIYNNGEIGYLIENRIEKTVVSNEDLFSLNESVNAIEDFYANEISQIFTC